MNYSRKAFLRVLGLGGLSAASSPLQAASGLTAQQSLIVAGDLTLGLASYTTRKYSLDETLAMAGRLNIQQIALKSMHLPLESSDEEIQRTIKKVEEAGAHAYGAGVVYMKSSTEVENAFRYAKAAQMEMIIGVPSHDLLSLVDQKVKETNIMLAIHNHGPGDDVYPTPEVVYSKIKSLDKRIGLCMDIGHVQRLGLDPVENIRKYADRLLDLHLKDVSSATAEGRSVELGRGVINIPAVIDALKEINYTGVMALEFEKDGDDVLPGLSECVGYAHGIMDTANPG